MSVFQIVLVCCILYTWIIIYCFYNCVNVPCEDKYTSKNHCKRNMRYCTEKENFHSRKDRWWITSGPISNRLLQSCCLLCSCVFVNCIYSAPGILWQLCWNTLCKVRGRACEVKNSHTQSPVWRFVQHSTRKTQSDCN